MCDYRLSKEDLAELRSPHRAMRDRREAYRLNAVILLGQGRSAPDVADALLLDPEAVRTYFKRYKQGGIDERLRMSDVGSDALLDAEQPCKLDGHLQKTVYHTAAEVARYVEQEWGVRYTAMGMTALLRRLGYRYKKPALQPGEPPAREVQDAFVEKRNTLKATKPKGAVILFTDAAHPQHNPVLACGWIKRGKGHLIESNTGRARLNSDGAHSLRLLLKPFADYREASENFGGGEGICPSVALTAHGKCSDLR